MYVYQRKCCTRIACVCRHGVPKCQVHHLPSSQIDLRGMLPSVAEVYLLAVLNALQRRAGSLKHLGSPVTLLLPTYDPRNVFWPSYAVRGEAEDIAEAAVARIVVASGPVEVSSRDSDSEGEDEAPMMAKEATALGVVGASWLLCLPPCTEAVNILVQGRCAIWASAFPGTRPRGVWCFVRGSFTGG